MVNNMTWRRGSFSVPSTVSDERVALVAHRYMTRFGDALEKQGFKVLRMMEPVVDQGVAAYAFLDGAYDRKLYVMWALVSRNPQLFHMETPDAMVPDMEKLGWKVN